MKYMSEKEVTLFNVISRRIVPSRTYYISFNVSSFVPLDHNKMSNVEFCI